MAYTKTQWVNGQAPAISAANLNKIENELENLDATISGLMNTLFPVGKVEIFYDNNDHSSYLGFTWQKIATGKALVGINTNDTDFNNIGKTGGSKTDDLSNAYADLMLTTNNRPYIKEITTSSNITFNKEANNQIWTMQNGSLSFNKATALGGTINTLPPYEVVAIWKRTA